MAINPDVLTMPRDQLEALQLDKLKKTVVYCYENIKFYKDLFDDAGFDPHSIETLDDIRRAPFTTKQDLRDQYPYGMFAVPKSEVKEIHMSSGTMGVATVSGYTENDLKAWSECFARGVHYANGTPDDIMHVCYGYGLFTGGMGAHYGGLAADCMTIPMSAGNTERQIQFMSRYYHHPFGLMRQASEHQQSLDTVRQIKMCCRFVKQNNRRLLR